MSLRKTVGRWAVVFCGLGVAVQAEPESNWKNPADRWTTLGPPRGAVMMVGGGVIADFFPQFLEMAGGPQAPIVIIPTASADKYIGENLRDYRRLKELGAENVTVLHTRDRAEADTEKFVEPLKKAKGVWLSGGTQSLLAEAYLHTRTQTELFALLDRGGIIAGSSAGASIQGSYLYGGRGQEEGFGFLRESVIGQHYVKRGRLGSVPRILQEHRDLLGLGLDEDTAVVVKGNQMEVIGDSKVAMYDARPADWTGEKMTEYLYAGDQYDLAARRSTPKLRVAASELWSEAEKPWSDPGAAWTTQGPPNGHLLLCGGKPNPDAIAQFIQFAGGPDAPLAVLSTGSDREREENQKIAAELTREGAKNVSFLHTINRDQANSTVFTAPLAKARGVWIGDGTQWKLADSYLKSLVHRRLFDVVERGGVVAGNGAGAAILATNLCGQWRSWGFGLLRKSVIWEKPLKKESADKLKELQAKEPGILALELKPEEACLIEGGRLKTLQESGGGAGSLK